ncbi:MAG: AAA family ATPase, partial [Eubacterium sp.]|nr:AAA family ATPase [Eubacterium sp.]
MGKMIVVGNDIFDEFIRDDGYYVDKTELIFELVARSRNKVTLFTRPRRFGKTLTMSMMESYFDIGRDSADIFAGRKIMTDHPEFCKEWMNQYPVLFLTLKDVEGRSFDLAYDKLKAVIADLCKKHASLAESPEADPYDVEIFQKLRGQTGSESEVQNSLKTIMRMMRAVYGKPAILLIDEYDVPLAKAEETKNKEFYQQMLDVIRGIMSISMKTNEYLKFAVITGCLRISKESIFTGVNNFACYSVTSRKFSQYFGFTQDEVAGMLDAFGMSEKIGLIKEWYDGYVFGNSEVFCPWDVASYL